MEPSRWHCELYSPTGALLADLSGRAKGRRIVESRNEAEEITWSMDLADFERYGVDLQKHRDPLEVIRAGVTEVRIRRGQSYICGGQVTYRNPKATVQGARLDIRASGFLNLLQDRHTDDEQSFVALNPPVWMKQLIEDSQSRGPAWDFGITVNPDLPLIGTHDKTYKSQELKDVLVLGSEQYNFDFRFSHDKVLTFYAALGSVRPAARFEFPGNILEIPGAPEDATTISNSITVYGSGSGTEGNVKTDPIEDLGSQADYKVRQRRVSYSDVEDIVALERHGQAELAARGRPFQIPQIVVDGNVEPFVTDYGVGDRVPVVFRKYRTFQLLSGLWRIERREIAIDDNDKERVTLYLGL